ncbi:unnamed protein product [Closterium sp. NIES-54]
MYALTDSAEGDCYLSVPPDPGIEAAALGASASAAPGASESATPGAGESALSGTAPTEALHTFTPDSGASRSFCRDSTTLTPLSRPVAVSLADPSGGLALAHSSTVLPCHAASSGLLSGLHLPSFSTNLVSGADLQDAWVDQFTPRDQHMTHCTCSRTGRHLATFTRRPGSSLYTLTTASPSVSASGQVAASSQVFAAASRSTPVPPDTAPLAPAPPATRSTVPVSLTPAPPAPAPPVPVPPAPAPTAPVSPAPAPPAPAPPAPVPPTPAPSGSAGSPALAPLAPAPPTLPVPAAPVPPVRAPLGPAPAASPVPPAPAVTPTPPAPVLQAAETPAPAAPLRRRVR